MKIQITRRYSEADHSWWVEVTKRICTISFNTEDDAIGACALLVATLNDENGDDNEIEITRVGGNPQSA